MTATGPSRKHEIAESISLGQGRGMGLFAEWHMGPEGGSWTLSLTLKQMSQVLVPIPESIREGILGIGEKAERAGILVLKMSSCPWEGR